MADEKNIAADRRYDSQLAAEAKIPQFVPPRPRDRRRLGMEASRAGYWCRRTANLAKEVAVARREAQEAKEMVQVVQQAHEEQMKEMARVVQEARDRQLEQAQEQMAEVRRLLSTSLEQSVQQQRDAAQAVRDTIVRGWWQAMVHRCRAHGEAVLHARLWLVMHSLVVQRVAHRLWCILHIWNLQPTWYDLSVIDFERLVKNNEEMGSLVFADVLGDNGALWDIYDDLCVLSCKGGGVSEQGLSGSSL